MLTFVDECLMHWTLCTMLAFGADFIAEGISIASTRVLLAQMHSQIILQSSKQLLLIVLQLQLVRARTFVRRPELLEWLGWLLLRLRWLLLWLWEMEN